MQNEIVNIILIIQIIEFLPLFIYKILHLRDIQYFKYFSL